MAEVSSSVHIRKWVHGELFRRNLMSPSGIIFLLLLTLGISYLSYAGDYLPIALAIGILPGLVILYFVFFKPLIGFYIICVIASFAFYPEHIFHIDMGLSTLAEILFWFSLLGSMRVHPPGNLKNNLLSSPITVIFVIYTVYGIIQFFNPELNNRTLYYVGLRKGLMFVCIYVIAYRIINTPDKFRFFLKFWIVIAFLAAAYGCYQQWFGLLPQEREFVMSNPVLYGLNFQGGQLRKFSFLSDVVQYGVFTGAIGVLALILAIFEKDKKKKYLLAFAALVMVVGMTYSGTRTTTFILPTGISLYILLTVRNKTTLITIFGSIMVALFVLFAPIYSNKTLNRVRSSFQTQDASLNVRDVNRHFIQPYMHKHPFGGGVGTTGAVGLKLDPHHYLADFPPDSGLLKIGIETGWIALILVIVWYLIILYFYIYTIFRVKSPEFRVYAIGLVCCLFGMMITQYSQVSIGQIPMVIFFISATSIVKRVLEFDRLGVLKT